MDGQIGTGENLGLRPLPPKAPRPVEAQPSLDLGPLQQLIAESQEKTLRTVQHIAQMAHQQLSQAVEARKSSALVSVYEVFIKILSARFILLLSVVGGFVLALLVLQSPGVVNACVLAGYVVSTVWPLVWLDVGVRRKGNDQ